MDGTKLLLLIKDLCARVPYNTIVSMADFTESKVTWNKEKLTLSLLHRIEEEEGAWGFVKPYLRSQSSMTEEEAEEMFYLMNPNDKLLKIELEQDRVKFHRIFDEKHFGILVYFFNKIYSLEQLDWYYLKHFDVSGLLPLNLAVEVTKDDNPYEIVCLWLKIK